MNLFPQLVRPESAMLAASRRQLGIDDAASRVNDLEGVRIVFTPTGGTRVQQHQVDELRSIVLELASASGYPDNLPADQGHPFDSQTAVALHRGMDIACGEASKQGLWEYLTCVLMPDIVRWRFPGGTEGTSLDHFLSGRRNCFQRLWWRAYLLRDPAREDHVYAMLALLHEDELVQIMERPSLAGTRGLTRLVGRELLKAIERHTEVPRRKLFRETQKRLMRLSSFVSFDGLTDEEIEHSVRGIFDAVARQGG